MQRTGNEEEIKIKNPLKNILALLLAAVIIACSVPNGNILCFAATVPAAPESLTAVPVSSTSIKLSWTASTGANGYIVYRYSAKTKSYARIKDTSSTNYTNTGLTTGTVYYYKVAAYRTVNEKNLYSKPSAKAFAKPVLPAPGSVKAASAGSKSIKISWAEVSGATGYTVFCFTASSKAYRTINAKNKTGCTDTGLVAGRIYYYRVSAYRTVNGKNIYGNLSSTVSATPLVGGTKTISYTWKFQSKTWTFSKTIGNDTYNKYKNSDRSKVNTYAYFVTNTKDDAWIKGIVDTFKAMGAKEGYSDFMIAYLMISFVQSMNYISDGKTDHPNFPLETIFNKGGDCEDTSILAAELLRQMGYKTSLIILGKHMGAGIKLGLLDPKGSTYYTENGTRYYFIETVAKGYTIGTLPDEFAGIKATVLPLS